MNEKLILLEINSSMIIGGDMGRVKEVETKLDRMIANNKKRITDMTKLK